MARINIIRTSPFKTKDAEHSLSYASKDDIFVLMDDGSYSLAHAPIIKKLLQFKVYVLQEHLEVRNIALIEGINKIDMADFVKLTTSHSPVVTWQ